MQSNKRVFMQKKTHAYVLPGIYGVGYAYTYGMTKVLKGKNFGSTVALMELGAMSWYALADKLKEVGQQALNLAKENPDYIFGIRKKFEKIVPQLTIYTGKIFKTDLSKLSKPQLWSVMAKYLKLYNDIYSWAEPITLGVEDSLGNYLKSYIKGKLNNNNLKSLTEIYNILISPKEKSFVRREADDLLEIAAGIQKDRQQKDFFRQRNTVSVKKLSLAFPKLYQDIKKHEADYCWVPYDYGVYLWDLKYFMKVLTDLVRSNNAAQELAHSHRYYYELEKKQKKLVRDLRIDAYHQKLFRVLKDCAFLLDYKKEQFTKSHYEIMPVMREIARRFKTTEILVRQYAPDELKRALVKGKGLPLSKLKSRYKFSVQYWQGSKFNVYDGRQARIIYQREIPKEKAENTDSLDGVIASAGKYVGRVRVALSAKELGDFRAGEILVTHMTSPDYVPAMKKAGAIITDKGGVTCHAAVVSRELGVPCVVGTQNATKVLKTGELVEVNANHNSVKILKK